MQQFYSLQMSLEPRLYRLRKHGDTIVRAFPIMYRELVVGNTTSFTRRRTHSIKRTPAPYSKLALRCGMLLRWASTHETSSRVNTTGTCRGLFARSIFPSAGKSCLSTARERKTRACNATFCVEAATWSCTARCARKARISCAPRSWGWRW